MQCSKRCLLYINGCSYAASIAIVICCRSHQDFNSSNKGLLTSYSNILFYTANAIPILVKYTLTKQMSILKKYDGDMPNIMKLFDCLPHTCSEYTPTMQVFRRT